MDPNIMDTSQSDSKTPATTQSGSVQSEDQHPPVVVALGTPVIPNDEEASELTTPQTPPFVTHPLGLEDASVGKKRELSLMKVQGDPAPMPMGHGNYTPGTQQGAKEGQALESLEEDQATSPAPTSCSKFFGKLTNTQWALVIAFLMILGLIIVVTVVLVGGGKGGGGGGGTADKVSDPAKDASPSTPVPTGSPSRAPVPADPSPTPSLKPVQDLQISPPTPSPTTLFPTLEPSTNQPSAFIGSETLETILTRGLLMCGITPGIDGFSTLNGDTYEGFEADLCRAMAAAVFGSADNLQFSPLEEGQAFIALQLGGVDVVASHVIHTMERDVYEPSAKAGFTFSVPYLYDGLTFGGVPPFGACADTLNATANCTALSICTVDGSSYSNLVAELIPNARQVLLPSIEDVYGTFGDGFCNAIAGARFEVSEEAMRNNGFTGSYEVGSNLYSREPLSLVTRDTDARWSDMVQWVLQALFAAEEQGVSMDTTQSFMTTDLFGDSFTNLFRNAIAAVGNYGDIYVRHLESIVPRTSINMINTGDSSLILSLPFGNLETSGPGPIEGGTLQRILNRGHLRCGITRAPGFAEFDATSGVWSGLDVDFCRAVSAAIFNGVADDVDYRVLPGTERFIALAEDDVDLLSRISTWNLERDVMEADAGTGFSFSQPDFYDGLAVGGIPPFGRCADILDTTSEFCQDLKICVASGTTTIDVFRSRFADRFIVPRLTHDEVVAGLTTGDCNVIAGGSQEVVESSVRDNGYTGPYEVGQNRFLKDPLAVVTRQDDPQFTSFVNWIVSATFYAEEEGIAQSTAGQMPLVFLFGPLYGRMLIDAIQAVGNYGEIYERNLQGIIPRGGQNGANVNPFGPQHYPLI